MKSRLDHRHHAIDAVVIALTTRSMLQRVTRAAKKAESEGRRLLDDLPEPWPGFVSEVAERIQNIVASHKPDTSWYGALHNDTNYGLVDLPKSGPATVVVRRPLDALATLAPEKAAKMVLDPDVRAKVVAALSAGDPTTKRTRLESIVDAQGRKVRRARMVERMEGIEPIRDRRTGEVYRVVKRDSNHRTEFWRLPDGKVQAVVISTFDAAQEAVAKKLGRRPTKDMRPHPAAKKIATLHKNDCLAVGDRAERKIFRVVKMSKGSLTLAECNEAGNLKSRDASKDDDFKYLSAGASKFSTGSVRKVWVDEIGRVHDGKLNW